MSLFIIVAIFILITLSSSVIIHFIRKYAIKNRLIDIPNNRSSHASPTPKSGGIAIVITMLITIMSLALYELIDINITLSMIVGLSIVATTGLIDDLKNLSINTRVIAYVFSIVISLYLIGGLKYISINNYDIYLNDAGYIIGLLLIFWIINLYNFMDGTDGFAAIQTICICLFVCYLFLVSNNAPFFILFFCLLSSTIAFLFWNWSPAKIFMGDVGSCSIGFLFGVFAIYTENQGVISLAVWLILLSPFIGDATYTLLKRIKNKEQWYKAHNSHAYQKIYQAGIKHNELALGLLVLNGVIVWPCAYFANSNNNLEIAMMLLSYSIIGIIWFLAQNKYFKIKSP